jgi:hypothetical protein
MGFGVIIIIAAGLAGVSTLIEISSIGDAPEYKTNDMIQPLYEASKFRRLAQYDAILIQRKT